MLRSVLIVLLLQINFLSLGQKPKIIGLISNAEFNVLYRGYENQMEMITCENCDSVYVFSEDAVITMHENGQFFVKPKPGSRNLTLTVKCVLDDDTTDLWSKKYAVKSLPQPNVYLGGIQVNKDFNHAKEVSLFGQTSFSVRYDDKVPLTGAKFRVMEWSIKIGKTTFITEGAALNKDFKKAFVKARRGTNIYFDYVTIIPPDGIACRSNLYQKSQAERRI